MAQQSISRTMDWVLAKPGVIVDRWSDGAIVFDVRRGRVQFLSETGAFLFEKLDGRHSVEDLVKGLVARYEVIDPKVAREDVEQFLTLVVGAGLGVDARSLT